MDKNKQIAPEAAQRLRDSKQKLVTRLAEDGSNAGRRWAETNADYAELKGLAAARERGGGSVFGPDDDAAWEFAVILADGDQKEARLRRRDYDEFWENWARSTTPASEFVEAFVDGALEVFDAFEANE